MDGKPLEVCKVPDVPSLLDIDTLFEIARLKSISAQPPLVLRAVPTPEYHYFFYNLKTSGVVMTGPTRMPGS